MQNADVIALPGQGALRLASAAFDLLRPVAAAQAFLPHWPEVTVSRAIKATSLPVLGWLGEVVALSSPTTSRLMGTLAELADELAWQQSYAAGEFGQAFLDRYGWTELIGPSGPISSDSIALGFLILGPDVHYPSHAHEAEELYLPLAGPALWQRGETAPILVQPGTPIHHPSWLPHAMWTQSAPLVALYCWRGGALGVKPQIVGRS